MYFSSEKYPEFKNKDKEYVHGALKYCIMKEKISRRFGTVFFIFFALQMAWAFYIEPTYFSKNDFTHTIIFSIVLWSFFYIYLVYEINVTVHNAVQKHIKTFEYQKQSSTG